MGSSDMALRLLSLSLFLVTTWLVLVQAQTSPDEAVTAPKDVPTAVVSSDPSEIRRQRLRNLFSRKREQRVKTGNGRQRVEGKRDGQTLINKRVRPTSRVTVIRNQKQGEPQFSEERIETSVSVSTSTKVRKIPKPKTRISNIKVEETTTNQENKTKRKRFRLVKQPKESKEALLEKLLANIDHKNAIEPVEKPTRRFRPSVKRDQIRKKAESALRQNDVNSRISLKIKKQKATTENTITLAAQEEEGSGSASNTESSVTFKHFEDERNIEPLTKDVPENEIYPSVIQDTEKDIVNIIDVKEFIEDVTTERQTTPLSTNIKSFDTTTKISRENFFRRNSPRRFRFGPKPSTNINQKKHVIIAKPTVTPFLDDSTIILNKIPKESEPNFGSFPVRKRLNPVKPKDELEQFVNKAVPVEIKIVPLPQPTNRKVQPAFNPIPTTLQPTLKLNTITNQIKKFKDSFVPQNSIVQPAFLNPVRRPQPVNVPETQRSIDKPETRTQGQIPRIQPGEDRPRAVIVQQTPQQPIINEEIFPAFDLPDFFKVPFTALEEPSSSTQQTPGAQDNAGVLFSSIGLPGQPLGIVQGHPRASNLNIITGSYSIGW